MKRCLLIISLVASCLLASAQSVGDQIYALIPSGEEVYRHGYNQLSEEEKAVYDQIIDAYCHFEANNYMQYQYHRVDFPDAVAWLTSDALIRYQSLIFMDVPEMYIMNSVIPRYDYDISAYYGRVGYQNTPENYLSELQQMQAIYENFSSSFTSGMSDYQKLLILHDAFINWGDYGDMTRADAGNIRGALLNKKAVCQGFAYAGLYLCQRAGLECIYVTGQLCTSTTNDTWTNHSWNYVKLDGQWYMMDLTTDGGFPNVVGYSAFLKGQTYLNTNYRLYSTDGTDPNALYGTLPTLSATDYDPNRTATELVEKDAPKAQKQLRDGQLVIRTPQGDMDVLGRIIR